jgi:hypothetical protein
MVNLAPAIRSGWGFSLCGSQVACPRATTRAEKGSAMAYLFAVLAAMALAIVISIAYALVLRELQRINANLERFIKLVVDARQREDARQGDVPIAAGAVPPAPRPY